MKSKEPRYQDISEEQLAEAQKRLDSLCDVQGLKSWSIEAKNGDWREIVLRMCGLSSVEKSKKKTGRPSNFTPKAKMDIAELVDLHRDFYSPDEDGKQTEEKATRYQAYAQVAKQKNIAAHKTQYTGKTSDPANTVRRIYNDHEKTLRERERQSLEDLARDHIPDDEPTYFIDNPNARKKARK